MSNPIKICMIIDKSEGYISFQRERILTRWKVDREDAVRINSLSEVGGATLFGDAPTCIIHLENIAAIKKFNESAGKFTDDELLSKLSSGLIITTSVARVSTKKTEAIIARLDGEIFAPPSAKESSLAMKLVSELNVTRSVRDMLLDYVGDDYDILIPIVDSLSSIPKNLHPKITQEDIYARFPQSPGSVAPWLIEKPLMAGNTDKTIDLFRRINQHSNYLVVIAIIRNKLQMAYRIAAMLADNPRISDNDLVASLDLKNPKVLGFAKSTARSCGVETLQRAVMIIARAESQVKGGSAAPNIAVIEKMLIELCLTLRKETQYGQR